MGIFTIGLVVAAIIRTSSTTPRPNILIMMADDLGMGDLGCFGNTSLKTPHLDHLAGEGVRLTHHLAAASVCTPSRAAFLTGRYPIRSGMAPVGKVSVITFIASTAGLPPSEVTFAELAKKAEFSTALIGKWHLGIRCASNDDFCHHPMKQGFDYYYGIPLTNLKEFGGEGDSVLASHQPYLRIQLLTATIVIVVANMFLNRKGYIGFTAAVLFSAFTISISWITIELFLDWTFVDSLLLREYEVVEQPIQLNSLTQRFVLEGQDFLQKRHQDGKPFLLFISWSHVHTFLANMNKFQGTSNHGRYGDAVQELDWGVGEILFTLDHLGFRNNTFVYFTSDNGGHVEETDIHGERTGGYNGIYTGGKSHGAADGGIRVPTIIRWPGVVPANTSSDEPTSLMDLYPTIAKTIGQSVPNDRFVDGRNLLPLLQEQTSVSPHEFLFHYFGSKVNAIRYRPRTGNAIFKLVLSKPNYLVGQERCDFVCSSNSVIVLENPELYNVADDPRERRPLDYKTNTDNELVVEKMKLALKEHQQSIVKVPSQYSPSTLLWRPWLQPCCNFPFCKCKDTKYNITD